MDILSPSYHFKGIPRPGFTAAPGNPAHFVHITYCTIKHINKSKFESSFPVSGNPKKMVVTCLHPNLKPCFKPLIPFPSQNPNSFPFKSLIASPKTLDFAKPVISLQVKAKSPALSDELPLDDSPSESSPGKEVGFGSFSPTKEKGLI